MNSDKENATKKVNNQQNYGIVNNSKEIFDQARQSIDVKNWVHPTGIITTNFHRPEGDANPYV